MNIIEVILKWKESINPEKKKNTKKIKEKNKKIEEGKSEAVAEMAMEHGLESHGGH